VTDAPLPLVSVVIATRNRPELVRKAVDSFLAQDYAGEVEVVLVYDQSDPDLTMAREEPGRRVRVITNTRTPGLAGARNTGVLASVGEWVAFCDDDDWWQPNKLTRQMEEALASPVAHMVTCSIAVEYDGQRSVRKAGCDRVTREQLLRSRMSMLHSSTFLFRRSSLLDLIGLVDEDVPGSQNEDWDLLLRASAVAPIIHVDEPLVVVLWGTTSFFSRTWETKVSSLHWMLDRHPDIGRDRKAAGRVYGQIAFGEASQGNRRTASAWARKALRSDPTQWRAVVSLAVAARLVTPDRVLNTLHRYGRGV
jgi:glycosyltransferase involved in cell wall biosynthesis